MRRARRQYAQRQRGMLSCITGIGARDGVGVVVALDPPWVSDNSLLSDNQGFVIDSLSSYLPKSWSRWVIRMESA